MTSPSTDKTLLSQLPCRALCRVTPSIRHYYGAGLPPILDNRLGTFSQARNTHTKVCGHLSSGVNSLLYS